MVKRLRRRPLTAESGVRFPYELLTVKLNSPTLRSVRNDIVSGIFCFWEKESNKQAICVNIEIDAEEIRINGMDGEYFSVTPEDVELYDYRWNGVSVETRTSSHVMRLS